MEDSIFVHPTAIVEEGSQIGPGSKIWHFVHVRNSAKIGSNVIIGKGSYVDENVKIGSDVKIQNLVSVYNGVTIGNKVFIGPHVTFTNDLFPKATGNWTIVETMIEDNVSIGANSTIICGVTLAENCIIGAGSVVTKNVPKNALFFGNPAQIKGWVCSFCARKILPQDTPRGTKEVSCQYCNQLNSIEIK